MYIKDPNISFITGNTRLENMKSKRKKYASYSFLKFLTGDRVAGKL